MHRFNLVYFGIDCGSTLEPLYQIFLRNEIRFRLFTSLLQKGLRSLVPVESREKSASKSF